ncbi:MAG: hypothetical protein JWQ90_595 [Hydrocarboniphaga sp.]|uniref:hypothetical protein n=1 Tax=Hydrocarboniphaga sp. TaxID=2033016 RepID=UPI002623694D|nr:hypothetical protein [Hydrocarboniphaga sp.]MDB5968145.1 hypothetical protein [Hydrocarboniphaga sp.]
MSAARDPLRRAVDQELRRDVPAAVAAFAAQLAQRGETVAAVLFYGSNLRTGDLDGVLDFYVLVDRLGSWHRHRLAALANRALPPNVCYETARIAGHELRAKVAVLSLQQFQHGMRAGAIDTSLWARFAQPLGLAWVRDDAARAQTVEAVSTALATAARWAALLGPASATAAEFWQALFQRTYAAELRVERAGGRARSLVEHERERYTKLLPLAWRATGVEFRVRNLNLLEPRLNDVQRRSGARAWRLRHAMGKPLNLARLGKATFTFDNGADYVAWKVERHSGLKLELSDFQRRHPLLAAPAILWKLMRNKVLR